MTPLFIPNSKTCYSRRFWLLFFYCSFLASRYSAIGVYDWINDITKGKKNAPIMSLLYCFCSGPARVMDRLTSLGYLIALNRCETGGARQTARRAWYKPDARLTNLLAFLLFKHGFASCTFLWVCLYVLHKDLSRLMANWLSGLL